MPKPSRKSKDPADEIVPHPRFGNCSVPSGYAIPRDKVLNSYWGYRTHEDTILPDSAIPADVSRQHYVAIPRACYVDILRPCRSCGRPFIFFAREQKYWIA